MEVEFDLFADTLESLLHCIKDGEVLSEQAPPSIYMVPSLVRDLSPSSFTPRMVAIGPLHRQDVHLQAFEVQKSTYLHNWLHRFGMVPEQTVRRCLQEVISSIERIKACYAGSATYSDFKLAQMMVMDACFILEFIQRLWQLSPSGTNRLITESIVKDMLLIENQIPFFVLESIFECTIIPSRRRRHRHWASITEHMRVLLGYYYYFAGNIVVPDASPPDHILGFLHKYYRPVEPVPPVLTVSIEGHTAMELDRAGMKFKSYEDEKWALAMKLESHLRLFPWLHILMVIPPFSWFQRPTLRMPTVYIGDKSELIFRNLIVYENSCDVEKYVTTYLMAMNMLIDTPEDVGVLVKSKVLRNYFSSNKEAADMINNLCKNIDFEEFFYGQQWKEMDAYYSSYWPNTLALLKRTYFNNPWSIIALVAAFLLFGLTLTQTIFTIKAA